ncbi:MAG: hypothetical protein WD845_10505 [Pirellulales bacterium]
MLRSCIVMALLGLATVTCSLSFAAAQDSEDVADPVVIKLDQRVLRFLDAVSTTEADDAFDNLLVGSPLLKQTDALESLTKTSSDVTTRYGAYRGSEQLSAKRVGKDLVLMKYLFKCEQFPLVWYFVFYRDFSRQNNGNAIDDPWIVISVRFDTQVELLFD